MERTFSAVSEPRQEWSGPVFRAFGAATVMERTSGGVFQPAHHQPERGGGSNSRRLFFLYPLESCDEREKPSRLPNQKKLPMEGSWITSGNRVPVIGNECREHKNPSQKN